ncbi:MAG: recombination protein RecR [Saprospiraceae bacterium]|jgi:recombination protein RecR
MSYSSSLLQNAVDALSTLPGIGKKSALRLALHLINSEKENVLQDFLSPIHKMVEDIKFCSCCHNLADKELCTICEERTHKSDTICIVETIRDVMAIEETSQFKGLYHVLGGIISPLDGITADDLNIDSLIARVTKNEIKELIMAISPTIEGETTIYYLTKKLKPFNVKVSILARGISFGGELEYADELTLGRSIITRIPYSTSEL